LGLPRIFPDFSENSDLTRLPAASKLVNVHNVGDRYGSPALLCGVTTFALAGPLLHDLIGSQIAEVAQSLATTDHSGISDRERARLRGPVRSVSEGSTRTEYDLAGRLISHRWLTSPGSESPESIETRTYDGSGRMLTDSVRDHNGALTSKVYSYDDQGKLARILEGSGDQTSFQYDDKGRKTELRDVTPKADDRKGAVATGVDVIFADIEGEYEFSSRTRNASRIKTTYDEHDQPLETQAFDADGHLLSRMVRSYDEKRRITDVRIIIEDPMSQFSAKQQAEMLARSDVLPDEIRAQLKKVFGAMMGESGKSYSYDAQGLLTKIVLHQTPLGEVTRTCSYNDHGDVVEEKTIFNRDAKFPAGVIFHADDAGNLVPEKPESEWPPQPTIPESLVQYEYQYDSYGNWTEQTVSRSESSEYTRHRELTYY
jgi:YD repeat-containing protein